MSAIVAEVEIASRPSTGRLSPGTWSEFDAFLQKHLGKPKDHLFRDLVRDVMKRIDGCFGSPDYQAPANDIRFGLGETLGESGVFWFRGDVLREHRIFDGFRSDDPNDVLEALRWLDSNDWIVGGFFRPSPVLDAAVTEALSAAAEKKNGKVGNPWKKALPFSPLTAGLILAGGDPRARLLLYQIRYWFDKAKMWRDGKRWIVKTRAEWCEETGLSRHQYDAALKTLKAMGLIEAEPHKSPFHAAQVATFLCPVTYVALGPRVFGEATQ